MTIYLKTKDPKKHKFVITEDDVEELDQTVEQKEAPAIESNDKEPEDGVFAIKPSKSTSKLTLKVNQS